MNILEKFLRDNNMTADAARKLLDQAPPMDRLDPNAKKIFVDKLVDSITGIYDMPVSKLHDFFGNVYERYPNATVYMDCGDDTTDAYYESALNVYSSQLETDEEFQNRLVKELGDRRKARVRGGY